MKHCVDLQGNSAIWPEDTYILFDGLIYNTRGYFASCVVFFRAPKGWGTWQDASGFELEVPDFRIN